MAHDRLLLPAFELLSSAEHGDDPFPTLLETLRDIFAFDQALVLEHEGDLMRCVAALPPMPRDLRLTPGPFIREVASGRVAATCGDHDEWREISRGLISSEQPALHLPMFSAAGRGVLILLRAAGTAGFDDADLARAREFALLALAAQAARGARTAEAQVRELRLEADELRAGESEARRDRDLLNGIIELLPVGLTVQDEHGHFILVNDAAAARLAELPAPPAGTSPPAPQPTQAAPRACEVGPLPGRDVIELEERIAGPAGERIWLTSRKPVQLLDRTLLLSTSLDITERAQLEIDLVRRAYSDDLTGLANRAMIEEHVEKVLRSKGDGGRFALAFIDLDNFKHINDFYSHAIGDALLVKVARRIAELVRETDLLARISGDEFVLLVDPLVGDDQIYATIESLLEKLKQPFHIEGFEVFTSASIGVSVYPEHGGNYEELRRNADSAMYRAKSGTKGAAAFFDRNMGRSVTARMELEQRLRLAIRDCEFSCAFQPKVDIRSQEIVGFETLVRWFDDDEEIQTPGTFIGLATELGLIDPITHFVLAEAIRSAALLDDEFGPGKTIAVNVAAKQAGNVHFMRSFAETLGASGCAGRFIVEVTEDAFMAKNQFQSQVLPMLRDIGTRVSIDDFGTGYSSLSVLADITADEIKIDRSFITAIHQRPRSQSVLKAIESVSQALGMSVVAEGVETFEELAYLQGATRIRYAQGFHFAKPFFIADITGTRRSAAGERDVRIGRGRPDGREAVAARAAAKLPQR